MNGMVDVSKLKPHPLFSDPNYPHHEELKLPEHFSMISAQTGSDHNKDSHQELKNDLERNGFSPIQTDGEYGYNEKSYMIPHKGEESHRTLEQIAWKHNQKSIIHSSGLKNRLVFQDGSPEWTGEGYVHGPFLKNYFTKLSSGHKFSLIVKEPGVKKADDPKDLSRKPIDPRQTYKDIVEENVKRVTELHKPHYYGRIGNVHVFHGTHEKHKEMIGHHIHSPTDEELDSTLADNESRGGGIL